MIWTDEKVITLKAGWLSGLTAPEIAAMVGTTPAAVRAKRDHLGLPSRDGEVEYEASRQAVRCRRTLRPVIPPKVAPPDPALMAPLPGSWPRPWLSRAFGECAFPVGGEGAETLSCCLPVKRSGRPYCKAHTKIVGGRA